MSSINRWVVQLTTLPAVSPVGFSQADAALMLRKAEDHLGRCAQGAANSNLALAWNPVAAQATITVTGTGTNGDTLTIAGPCHHHGNLGGSPCLEPDQHRRFRDSRRQSDRRSDQRHDRPVSELLGWAHLGVSNVAGVITLTVLIPGVIGNVLLATAKSSTAITITHDFGASVAGSEGTAAVFSMGK
jgi:hypothetical protein